MPGLSVNWTLSEHGNGPFESGSTGHIKSVWELPFSTWSDQYGNSYLLFVLAAELTCWNYCMTLSWKWRSKRGIQNGDVWLKPPEEKLFSRSRKILLMTCLKAYKKCSQKPRLYGIARKFKFQRFFRGLQTLNGFQTTLLKRNANISSIDSKPKSALSALMF